MLGVIAGVVLGVAVVALAGVSTCSRSGSSAHRAGLNTQIAISALLVVIVTRNADDYAVERIWETGVGSVVTHRGGRVVLPPPRWQMRAPVGRRTHWPPISPRRRAPSRPETLLPARCSRTPRSMPARPRGQSRTSRARCGALRLSPLRRRSRPELELVAQRQRLALRLAIQVRRLARDLASFAHRDDVEDQWREAARRLPPIIGLVAAASSRALAGEGCSREVASAREIMADYRREDARPVSAILRRPLVLLLDELAGPPA